MKSDGCVGWVLGYLDEYEFIVTVQFRPFVPYLDVSFS